MRAGVNGSGLAVVVAIVGHVIVIVTEDVDRGLGPKTGKGWFCCCLYDVVMMFLHVVLYGIAQKPGIHSMNCLKTCMKCCFKFNYF